jgi:hypothetical protein
MEYAVTLLPLAALATIWRDRPRRLLDTGVMLLSLGGVLLVYLFVRSHVSGMVSATPGASFLSFHAGEWVRNAAMILASSLFFGDTVPFMIEPSAWRTAWLGANVVLVALAIGIGLWVGAAPLDGGPARDLPRAGSEVSGRPRSSGFALCALVLSLFPVVFMKHISEIYLTTVIVALALLMGLAAEGWTRIRRPLGSVALALAVSQLLFAADAIQAKVADIRSTGERADAMMQQLLGEFANAPEARRVAAVFKVAGAEDGRGYSVFLIPDEHLIMSPFGGAAVRWYRPDLDVQLDPLIVTDPASIDRNLYDLILVWDPASRRFGPIPSGGC